MHMTNVNVKKSPDLKIVTLAIVVIGSVEVESPLCSRISYVFIVLYTHYLTLTTQILIQSYSKGSREYPSSQPTDHGTLGMYPSTEHTSSQHTGTKEGGRMDSSVARIRVFALLPFLLFKE